MSIHPNLKQLSDSSDVLLRSCARRYQLYKLSPTRDDTAEEEGDKHTKFGSVVGEATQEYFVSGDINRCYLTAFRSWPGYIDEDAGERDKKTFWHALYAIDRFATLRSTVFGNFKIAYFNGKAAREVGFSIDLGDGFFYRGFIDAVLVDEMRNELVVYEGKTTKNREVHEATFKNSGQGLGYSLVLDAIAKLLKIKMGTSYTVKYCVYKSTALEWEVIPFQKSHLQRALWLRNILISKQRVMEFGTEDYWPMYGESCFKFFRACPYFGVCELSDRYIIGEKIVDKVEKKEKYDFHFSLQEIIDTQLEMAEQEIVR